MHREMVSHAVLSALGRYDKNGPAPNGISIDGCTEEEIVTAFSELQEGGYINGFALTDDGRRLLRSLESTEP